MFKHVYTPSYTFLIRIYYVFKRSCISILITGKSFVCVNVACFSLHHNEVFHCCTKWFDFLFGRPDCSGSTASSHSIFGQEYSISYAD